MEVEYNLCKHTRLASNCPVCEFEAKPKQTAIEFLDSLPLEFPEEFPEFWGIQRGEIQGRPSQRILLKESEETYKVVSDEGFEGTGTNDQLLHPYERLETIEDDDEIE